MDEPHIKAEPQAKAPQKIGRPRRSSLTRREQLCIAKREQRERQRERGMVKVELTLSAETAQKLKAIGMRNSLPTAIETWVEQHVVDIDQAPGLREIAWNRKDRFLRAEEALALYERNWRFVDQVNLLPAERKLIERLVAQFGNGVMNV